MTAGEVRLSAGDAALTLDPASGGRMTSLRVGEHELLLDVGPSGLPAGCFPMAPYAGRVRRGRLAWGGRTVQLPITFPPHAIHGLVWDRAWDVLDVSARHAEMRCSFDREWWPWGGFALSRFTLGEGRLETVLEVNAEGDEMPAWCGWHPWFRRTLGGSAVALQVAAEGMLPRDSDGIPTGNLVPVPDGPLDDALVRPRWPAVLTWPGVLRLFVSADVSIAVVFTEREEAVCVEPQTAPPDAAALGQASVVRPGERLVMTMTWEWARD